MVIQASPAVADVRHVEHHVARELVLERDRPVLEARQRQPVRRHGYHICAVRERRVDEGRLPHPILRETIVEVEGGRQPIGQIRRQQVRLEPDRRLTDELIERDA